MLAWAAASAVSAAVGAALFVALVAAHGLTDWVFLAQVWLGLAIAGLGLALVGGGAVALVAVAAAHRLKPPRPLADVAMGALGAFVFLLLVRAWMFARMEEPLAGIDFGAVLLIPLVAGASAGWVYWRLAGRPGRYSTTPSVSVTSSPLE